MPKQFGFDGVMFLDGGDVACKGGCTESGCEGAFYLFSFEFGAMSKLDQPRKVNVKVKKSPGMKNRNITPEMLQQVLGANFLKAGREKTIDAKIFSITKQVDEASPILFEAYCSGTTPASQYEWPTGVVHLRRPSATAPLTFLKMTFEMVAVYKYTLSTSGDDFPVESVEFSFWSWAMEYYQQLSSGGLDTAAKEAKFEFG